MLRLLSLFSLLAFALSLQAQNPHGADMKMNCASCHTPAGWEITADYWRQVELTKPKVSRTTGMPLPLDTSKFHHNKTTFPLTGSHANVDCRACHQNLAFAEAKSNCNACHTDMHQQTVGMDCARCHTTNNWMVDKIFDLHMDNGMPLTGVHKAVSCDQCHTSASTLQFNRIGNDCISCHRSDFEKSKNPDHKSAGFSTDCTECHDLFQPDWHTDKVDHSFFPLTKGHDVADCARCHTGGDFANTPNNCFACHQPDFQGAQQPNHVQANFSNDCKLCHTTDPDWIPAKFLSHDTEHFPIYSGKHQGQWTQCTDCHINPSNYAENSCTVCHVNPETNNAHGSVNGYIYENSACLACHPTGDAGVAFDHNTTNFPLTGAHLTAQCAECHANGYVGTPTQCSACHTTDFNGSTNPNHVALGIPTDCAMCHTTAPGWSPATFPIHNNFYALNGAHAAIASDCATCHNGNYNNTPNTCAGCHTPDYNAATSLNHVAEQLPTDCATCHSETAWAPSTFDHNTVFPLTGAHQAIANDCNLCHVNGNYANTPNTCAGCHTPDFNSSTNPNHVALGIPTDCAMCHTTAPGWAPATFPIHNNFYPLNGAHATIASDCATCHNGNYNNTPNTCAGCHTPDYNATTAPNHAAEQLPTDCATCHSESAWVPSTFNHNTVFPLTGAHQTIANDCNLCHINGNYTNTPNTCAGCHTPDFNSSVNPNHASLNLPTDCAMCHTTAPGWAPATFPIHNNFYQLNGAHATIANDCATCHNGNYNTTPNTCFACHTADYNQTTDPNHASLQFSNDCTTCHTETAWSPATFDHDAQYFPIYSGKHAGEWNACTDCHTNPANYAEYTCTTCHANPQTDNEHTGVGGYVYTSPACLACHPTGDAQNIFDHNTTAFPLTGAHQNAQCMECHAGGFAGTPTQCSACHTPDFNSSTNPNHVSLGIPTDCAMCHTTAPGWAPATFPIHNNYYALSGAHAAIANDCATCHNGNYNSTPNTCAGCHTPDYNATTAPNHVAEQLPTDCATCHAETAWVPSTFNHNTVFPLTGAHQTIANDCNLCHINGNYTNTPNTCAGCHTPDFNAAVNPNHVSLNLPTDCAMCHTTAPGWEPATFPIHSTFYALNGAHAAIANDCATCHNGNYNNTPNTCAGCHTPDYNATTNPNHVSAHFPTDCASCHTETTWAPANFDHDGQYFPIYSGDHNGEWSQCIDCHSNPSNYAEVNCLTCHTNPQTDNEHNGVGGYTYNSAACLACHPTGDAQNVFDHNTTNFPLTGAHQAAQCIECHAAGYAGTPTQCAACHTPDFNSSVNPNHVSLGISTDCAMCHTTAPGWAPATFPIHNNFYALNGAHAAIANDCATCHNGNYNNTPNTCAGCHTPDYNATTAPNHVAEQLPTDCATCHAETSWIPSTFNHNTVFPLTGAHQAIANDCNLCHINGNYSNTPNTCAGCHTPDFNSSTNPNHVSLGIPTDCAMCHTTAPGWAPATFPIHNNYYALNGAHAAIANDCATCHNGNYNTTPNTCAGCHTPDYNATTNPNHQTAQFPTDCALCHTETAWTPSNFDHNAVFPLTGAHQTANCTECHINGNYNNTPTTCAGCHTPDFNSSTNPNHVSLGIPTDCAMCHTTAPGWAPATFPIHNNYYALNGAHAAIANDCATCHNGNYNTTPNTCAGCHTPDYNATTNPNHQTAQFPTDCALCHTETAWTPSNFDHNAVFPLTGAHQTANCTECHINGNYSNTPNTCAGCHTPDFNSSTNPNHVSLGIPTDCAMCHTTAPGWAPATFPIHNNYYALNGAHAAIANDCATCHNGNYNNTPNTCAGCHTPDYNATTNPNHQTAQFPTDCALCHTETAWTPSNFDHNAVFPLTGAHQTANCTECHINGNYSTTPNTCAGCHTPDFNSSTNPNHVSLGIPTDCAMCHTTAPGWAPATFPIHNNYYALNGAHAAIANDCATCHNGNYNTTPNTCAGCHTPDYNATTNPNHQTAQFPTDCALCHTETAWTPSNFDHNAVFPLTGAHQTANCTECHINGNYSTTPNTCAGCHTPDFNSSTNPNHVSLGIPTDCAMCHTTAPGWAPATFPIHNNYYALNGAHAAIANDCATCHNGNYNNTPNTCAGCHIPDYNATTNPNHQTAQFPTDCALCHTETAWTPSNFDHNAVFPLTGEHQNVNCNLCHVNGNYNNTPNTCAGCHTPDYNSSTNPNHQSLSIPTDCAMCHTTDPDWMPATFPIHNNYWVLDGAHTSVGCAACHNGNYNNTPTNCFGCHASDYNTANNPNHVSAGFPTTCQNCHTTTAWEPSTWNHDQQYFPIYSGKHKNEWDACVDCHTTPGNFTLFSCIDCHEHDDPADMADHHQGVSGYQYNSNACYTCHPDGSD